MSGGPCDFSPLCLAAALLLLYRTVSYREIVQPTRRKGEIFKDQPALCFDVRTSWRVKNCEAKMSTLSCICERALTNLTVTLSFAYSKQHWASYNTHTRDSSVLFHNRQAPRKLQYDSFRLKLILKLYAMGSGFLTLVERKISSKDNWEPIYIANYDYDDTLIDSGADVHKRSCSDRMLSISHSARRNRELRA